MYYYRSRYYSAGNTAGGGRFLEPDSIMYKGGLNLYAYTGGDPINNVDPLGEDSQLICRSVMRIGAHCFVFVTNSDGSERARFSYGPQNNSKTKPGKLVETFGNKKSVTNRDDRKAQENGKGKIIDLNKLGFSDDDIVAAGENVDKLLGTVDNPGPTQYKFNANGRQRGKANSNGGAARVLQDANKEAAKNVPWPGGLAGAVGRRSADQVGVAPLKPQALSKALNNGMLCINNGGSVTTC